MTHSIRAVRETKSPRRARVPHGPTGKVSLWSFTPLRENPH